MSKQTLINWSKELRTEIANLKAVEWHAFRRQAEVCREHRITFLSSQMQSIRAELAQRDFAAVSTEKLMELAMKLNRVLRKEDEAPVFAKEQGLCDLRVPGESWTA